MKHKASPQRRLEQIQAFYDGLPSAPSGRITRAGNAAFSSWCDQEGISTDYARALMRGHAPKPKPFNQSHALKCAAYLEQHGYTVIEPK